MTTLAELRNARNVAGARYQAALNELHGALVDLAAMDSLLSVLDGDHTPGFPPLPPHLAGFFHARYAPAPAVVPNLHDLVKAKRDEISRTMEP